MLSKIQAHKQWLYPIAIIVIAYLVANVIKSTGPEVEVITPVREPTGITTVIAETETVELTVYSQGEVSAEYMIDFSAEVTGRVVRVSPSFVTGGYFKQGDVLLEIDKTDYELSLIKARANVVEAIENYELEKAEAKLAKEGLFSAREAKVKSSQARVESAKAELAQAQANLDRTEVKAPFDGRLLFNTVGLGQYVSKGESLGKIFSTAIAEIRLPITDEQLAYLDFPFGPKADAILPPIDVALIANIAGKPIQFDAYLHRMDGALDPDNRVWYAVARMDDPYRLESSESNIPLTVGLFVEAAITGRTYDNLIRLPRSALRNDDEVYIVNTDSTLSRRQVSVLKTDFDYIYIAEGIKPGEQVCTSSIQTFIEGMPITVKQTIALSDN